MGLIISVGMAWLGMPGFFQAAGILLPMAYGQGPGQANNVGITYEALGFVGGQSFGLSLAVFLLIQVFGITQDVTERVLAEQERDRLLAQVQAQRGRAEELAARQHAAQQAGRGIWS